MKLDVRGSLQQGDLLGECSTGEHRLIACPACLLLFPRKAGWNPSDHIATHDPEDFGLSPIGERDGGQVSANEPAQQPELVTDGGEI